MHAASYMYGTVFIHVRLETRHVAKGIHNLDRFDTAWQNSCQSCRDLLQTLLTSIVLTPLFVCFISTTSLALVGMLQSGDQAGSEGFGSSEGGAAAFASKTPLKKILTKNRYYMETGNLSYDDAVLNYISKLDDHRRKCETEGRLVSPWVFLLCRMQFHKTSSQVLVLWGNRGEPVDPCCGKHIITLIYHYIEAKCVASSQLSTGGMGTSHSNTVALRPELACFHTSVFFIFQQVRFQTIA